VPTGTQPEAFHAPLSLFVADNPCDLFNLAVLQIPYMKIAAATREEDFIS